MAVPIAAIIKAAGSIGAGVINYWGSKGQNKLYDAEISAYEANADLAQKTAERQADYLTQDAASQVHVLRKQGEQLKGEQLAAMAASGMDISSGSAQDVLSASERAMREDEDLIRYNAELSALETRRSGDTQAAHYRHQASQSRIAQKQASVAAKAALYSTLLTAGSEFASDYFDARDKQKYNN